MYKAKTQEDAIALVQKLHPEAHTIEADENSDLDGWLIYCWRTEKDWGTELVEHRGSHAYRTYNVKVED